MPVVKNICVLAFLYLKELLAQKCDFVQNTYAVGKAWKFKPDYIVKPAPKINVLT